MKKLLAGVMAAYLGLVSCGEHAFESDKDKKVRLFHEAIEDRDFSQAQRRLEEMNSNWDYSSGEVSAMKAKLNKSEDAKVLESRFKDALSSGSELADHLITHWEREGRIDHEQASKYRKLAYQESEEYFHEQWENVEKLNEAFVRKYLETFPQGKYRDIFAEELALITFEKIDSALDGKDYETILSALRKAQEDLGVHDFDPEVKAQFNLTSLKGGIENYIENAFHEPAGRDLQKGKAVMTVDVTSGLNRFFIRDRNQYFGLGTFGVVEKVEDDKAYVLMDTGTWEDEQTLDDGREVGPEKNKNLSMYMLHELRVAPLGEFRAFRLRRALHGILQYFPGNEVELTAEAMVEVTVVEVPAEAPDVNGKPEPTPVVSELGEKAKEKKKKKKK